MSLVYQKQQFELLAPGGDLESIKAAIAAGADAIYCGLDRFNARNRAANITLDVLDSVVELAHQHDCKIFLTLNIVLLESELRSMIRLLTELSGSNIDGVIVQDLGLAYIIKRYFPSLDMHASTQMNTHNEGQIALLSQLGASRVNLSRELNLDEITHLAQVGRQHNVLMEVFVHGSYCIGFSGLCYFSSERNGASGNRGRCSQPCRDQYQTTAAGKNFPLNLKDNSAFGDLAKLAESGVYSLKIEGRIKKPHYVFTAVENWRKQIDHFCASNTLLDDMSELYTVFNRDFSNGYLLGNIHSAMYIDNPRNHAATHFSRLEECQTEQQLQAVKRELFDKTTTIMQRVEAVTEAMQITSRSQRSLKGKDLHIDIELPKSQLSEAALPAPKLSVLIDSPRDLDLLNQHPDVQFIYHLPDGLNGELSGLVAMFEHYPNLGAYFPGVLIGENYRGAEQLLAQVRPKLVVTDNLGVAHLAQSLKLNWVAGPQLNITNSLALTCIDQELSGAGAFVSNELSREQLKRIVKPQNFRLFYSIYHPITLMTSRQCLLMQSVGCKKQAMNKGCLKRCEKSASIINLSGRAYVIDKQKGSYNRLYSDVNYLNVQVLNDLPNLFTDVMVDMRNIATQTQVNVDKSMLIRHFYAAIQTRDQSGFESIESAIKATTHNQYRKGV
ncbi:peptidase U32 family protein [Vibrio xiamenensis]|uniref:peptidase U32 family protein n=1 Tax=Vibrio xiamenensis TaxID=861298 RepID=UPI003CCC346E